MGTLNVGALDFNEIESVEAVRNAIAEIARRPDSYHALQFKRKYYLEVEGPLLPSEAGWYIILDGTQPLYVGKASNLNDRLNTNAGTTDNFAKHTRKHDPERNFIKKFIEIGAFAAPRVCIIPRSKFAATVGMTESCLTDTDEHNIEKVINLLRNGIAYP